MLAIEQRGAGRKKVRETLCYFKQKVASPSFPQKERYVSYCIYLFPLRFCQARYHQ